MNTHSLGCWHGSMKPITGNKYHVFSWRAASPERLEFSLSFSRLHFSLNRFHAALHSSSTYTALMYTASSTYTTLLTSIHNIIYIHNATERFHRRHAAGVDKRTATREKFNKPTKSQFQPRLATAQCKSTLTVHEKSRKEEPSNVHWKRAMKLIFSYSLFQTQLL